VVAKALETGTFFERSTRTEPLDFAIQARLASEAGGIAVNTDGIVGRAFRT
jgi:hypothetical protein